MAARKPAAKPSNKASVDLYRIFQTCASVATLLLVAFGGISVWTTIISNQNVTQAVQQRQGDDIKDLKTTLQIISDKITSVQIGLAGKEDKKQ